MCYQPTQGLRVGGYPLARTRAAGLTPEPQEFLINHVHSHLDIFIDGTPVAVPAGIGIDITNPRVRRFEEGDSLGYGGIDPPCETPCISPLHTHDDTGILHTESKTAEKHTPGQFFTEWGLTLNDSCVADFCRPAKEIKVYVNGNEYGGNPASIPLEDRTEIAIVKSGHRRRQSPKPQTSPKPDPRPLAADEAIDSRYTKRVPALLVNRRTDRRFH